MPEYESSYERRRLDLLREVIPPGPGRALDVGCNEGAVALLLKELGWTVMGIDPDAAAIEKGRRIHPDLDLRTGTLDDLPDYGSWDLITCLEVVEHLQPAAAPAALAALAGHLGPGGRLVLSTPGRWSLVSVVERLRSRSFSGYDWWDATHVNVVSARRLRRQVETAGLRVVELVGFHLLPQRFAAPFPVRGPLARACFDLIVVARRR